MTVKNIKTSLALTKKHLEKIAKSKRTKHRDILQVIKYSEGNKATVTDSCRALFIKYKHENFGDSFDNIHSLRPMDVTKYPDVDRVVPNDAAVPNKLKIEHSKIKEMLTTLREWKKLKIENMMISFEKGSDSTQCYLESKKSYIEENESTIKLYLGSFEETNNNNITFNTEYFLNIIQFVKDTKEDTVLKFGSHFNPIVFENELADKFDYQYILCPIRVY
ncbi:hypothetical protein [Staphylococcus shinii]|uniref:hypothetical protein n=1 Tax=Staphylococcus shinii TaxID=2912228 RepID=UPI003F5760DC